jgi:hypothetical protein
MAPNAQTGFSRRLLPAGNNSAAALATMAFTGDTLAAVVAFAGDGKGATGCWSAALWCGRGDAVGDPMSTYIYYFVIASRFFDTRHRFSIDVTRLRKKNNREINNVTFL